MRTDAKREDRYGAFIKPFRQAVENEDKTLAPIFLKLEKPILMPYIPLVRQNT